MASAGRSCTTSCTRCAGVETTTNNYGFAPAETADAERFQLQLYAELLKLLGAPARRSRHRARPRDQLRPRRRAASRGAAPARCAAGDRARFLEARDQVLPDSLRGSAQCRLRARPCAATAVCRRRLRSGGQRRGVPRLWRRSQHSCSEVRRVLRPGGRLLYGDHRTRRKIARLEQRLRAAGLAGRLRDMTANVVRACELDSTRRRALIRAGLPWWCRPLGVGQLEQLRRAAGNGRVRAVAQAGSHVFHCLPDRGPG